MNRTSYYYKQVTLLVQLLSLVAEEDCFALKGGTAINLFIRDLPRLSVDIDLVYLPLNTRQEALKAITDALSRIAIRIKKALTGASVIEVYKNKPDALRLVVSHNRVKVQIELSPVLRGTIFKPEICHVCSIVEKEFAYAEMAVMAIPDLYAGKICAALDRQHPRDLFDVKYLLDQQGLTNVNRQAFIVYLISNPRPIAELLNPIRKDIKHLFNGEFHEMEEEHVSLEQLESTREELISVINAELTDKEKQFLLTFKNKTPDWNLLELQEVKDLPAVKWKLINLNKMSQQKHREALDKLEKVLN